MDTQLSFRPDCFGAASGKMGSARFCRAESDQPDQIRPFEHAPSKSFSFVAFLEDLLCQFGDPSTLAFKDHLQAGKFHLEVNITRESIGGYYMLLLPG